MKGFTATDLATGLVLDSVVPSKEPYGMCFKIDELDIKKVDINPLASASHWSKEASLIFNSFAVPKDAWVLTDFPCECLKTKF